MISQEMFDSIIREVVEEIGVPKESLSEKHQRADQELKKRVLKLGVKVGVLLYTQIVFLPPKFISGKLQLSGQSPAPPSFPTLLHLYLLLIHLVIIVLIGPYFGSSVETVNRIDRTEILLVGLVRFIYLDRFGSI